MPKKRTKSQKVGEIGENIFKDFALENDLLPNKVEYDYGIDFVRQTTNKLTSGIDAVGGVFVGVNVKSSKAKRIRAKLNKDDLEAAFLGEFPVIFILVDTNQRVVYYKFLDIPLLEELYRIYQSGGTLTLTPSFLNKGKFDDSEFKKQLLKTSSKEYQDRIKIKRIHLNLSKIIDNCELKIINNPDGNIAIVKATKIEDLYNFNNPNYPQVRKLFLAQDFTKSWLPPSSLSDGILDNIGNVASKIIMVAPVEIGEETEIFIKQDLEVIAKCKFTVRKLHDETAFSHPAGISLVFSEGRKHEDGLHYHHFDVLFDEDNSEPLFEYHDIIEFILACKEGNQLFLRKSSQTGIPIEHWPELVRLCQIMPSLKMIYEQINIDPSEICLSDIQNIKFAVNFSVLQFLIESKQKKKETLQGFVLTPEETPLFWEDAMLNCPLLFSIPEGNILLNGRFEGKMAFDDEEMINPVGARLFSLKEINEINSLTINELTFPTLSINGTMSVEYTDDGPKTKNTSPIETGISYSLKR
jgi:hypothetical protein